MSGETRPIADAGQQVTDEQIEHVVRTALDMFASEAARSGDVVLVRDLPAPYRLVAHRRVERHKDDGRGSQVTVYLTEGFAIIRRPAGNHWQVRFTIDSRVGHFEDEELLARLLRSLQFER